MHMKKYLALFLLLCMLMASMATAADAPLRVTATFYPLYLATINVARDVPGLNIVCLAPPSAGCLHDYQMSTADRKVLSDTDVLVINGAGLEVFLDKLLPQLSATVIDASAGIDLLSGHHEVNAHIWVSIPGMMREVNNIADGLSAADPAHTAQYRQNADDYNAKLETLYNEMKETLAPFAGEPIVTFHEAFDYFAQDFGLRVVETVQHEHETAPSGRTLALVADEIRKEHVRALFAEPQYEDASVDVLSKETGVPVYLLDPAVSGEVDPQDFDAYLRIMESNMHTLVEALQ